MVTATAPMEIPTVPPPALPPEEHVTGMRGQGVHAKALRIRAFWFEIGKTFKGDQQHLIKWNQSMMKTCRRRRESKETFLQFVE